ncbi:SCP2 sterol-binding domain-containing protein [Meridianimarinicoccus aquatilis]|uniref:SCP2 sterol-binding domain-containing protein n=1 Tax=Meridianimarinicoccus aquatilis TaxID=2552766 RepID=A0A4R6B4A6_9RHOB|nr:SCP2 sterol-binding domain-containing protein [Fluviibacterium aquatile]TDL91255.1 SCP2 sterol-binding domain-containing protein [Fluviibacterium aquatile]
MSDIIDGAVSKLDQKLGGSFDGSAKFEIENEGTILVDQDGIRAGDSDTDVTLSADAETFREMLEGDLNPTAAYMGGRLRIDGDMGLAMKLGAALS